MPYANIHWVKIKLEILNDKRFIFDCNDSQKWLYIGLLLLAGSTENKIPNEENYIRNRLNLSETIQETRANLLFLLKVFPKMITKNGFISFINFNQLHNRIGISEGTPMVYADKIRIEQIRTEYISLKGFVIKNLLPTDYARMGKAIKSLLERTNGDAELVIKGLQWISKQNYSWTLETLDKKWIEFTANPQPPKGGAEARELK